MTARGQLSLDLLFGALALSALGAVGVVLRPAPAPPAVEVAYLTLGK